MSNAMSTIGQQVWQEYQEIVRVIETRYPLSAPRSSYCKVITLRHSELNDIERALQRLGEAVLIRHNLTTQDHPITKRWRFHLQSTSLRTLKLSTTEAMIHAKIIQWEEEIPSLQAGYDTWTEGRKAGYRPQESLQETLEYDYSTIKAIVDTSPQQACNFFSRIQTVVQIELDRLAHKDSSKEKIKEITNAVQCLQQAITYKYKMQANDSESLSQYEQVYIDSIDLYSFNTMLDAKVKKWSLRQALNLSTDSPLSKIFGLQKALWGKTTALENVERTLLS